MKNSLLTSAEALQQFRTKLRRWYAKHKRELPWRITRNPYDIWLSEIMLQQTTVATVIPYYRRFLEHFPTVTNLAQAEESEVLKLWEGLGYYSRARNIHKTATIISSQYRGIFPQQSDQLQALPGIGRYTAGAIISFAFNKPAPIVEANTQRLYSRLGGYDQELANAAGQRFLWSTAEKLLPIREPGSFNQAVMELGSQVCTPVDPDCDRCPVSVFCSAYQTNRQHEIPRPKRKPKITDVTHLCIAVEKKRKFLLHQYPEGERWAGLWDFPRWELDEKTVVSSKKYLEMLSRKYPPGNSLFDQRDLFKAPFAWVENEVESQYQFEINLTHQITTIQHSVTRYRIRLICLQGKHLSGRVGKGLHNSCWVSAKQLDQYPLSTTARKMAKLIQGNLQ
ncbi:MAG: A/G-specific adenine glycosylase [Planctomycetaceae bacterium]|nr:A/G-specific adenine glycosylase [Planctomycetaceae bacterium]MBL4886579.1 A/G-specific adenine glycosylase [Planctomycetaceae bacterium]